MKLKFNRRFFLQSAAATVALPIMESLNPLLNRYAYAAQTDGPKFCFLAFPIGNIHKTWEPVGYGSGFQLPSELSFLAPYKNQLILPRGLKHPNFRGYGPNSSEAMKLTGGAIPGGHHFLSTTFLTANIPRLSGPVTNSISVDNRVANILGQSRSVYIRPRELYPYDEGYSKEYLISYSWEQNGVKNTALDTPKKLFENLFGICNSGGSTPSTRYQKYLGSILDGSSADLNYLKSKVDTVDRARLEQFTTSLRETEMKLQHTTSLACAHPEYLTSDGAFPSATQMFLDIITLGLQSGNSKVFTYLMDQDISQRNFSWIGINDGHHSLSHDPSGRISVNEIKKISKWYAEQFGYLLGKLQKASILDSTVCFFGSNMTNIAPDEAHVTYDLPIILGGGSNYLNTGQGLNLQGTPLANLHLSLIQKAGGTDTSFGMANPDPSVYYYPGSSNIPNPISTGTINI